MRILKSVAVFLALSMLVGCATKRQMTRDEYLQVTQRTYTGKTPDDVLRAAEKLFTLADGDDFTFHHTDDSLTASRPWMLYLIIAASMGTDTWLVRTKEDGSNTRVSALVSTSTGTIAPMATTAGDWTAAGLPGGGNIVAGTAIYDVFWARMDYLLGSSDKWMSCEEADARLKAGDTWGVNEALCNSFNMKNDLPEDIRP